MKHIFTIHSPLTFLVAYSTIKHLTLRNEDVILISSKYQVPIQDFKVAPSFAESHARSFWQKLWHFNLPKSFDRYIDRICEGENFIAYIDLMSYYQRLLVTHSCCLEFNFIEEGNSTYQEFDDLDDITWHERDMKFRSDFLSIKTLVRMMRGYNLRLLSMPYIYSAYTNIKSIRFFCFSSNAYYNISASQRVILHPDSGDEVFARLGGGGKLINEVIWIDGSNSKYTGLDESYYLRAIERAIPLLESRRLLDKQRVFVKLRPGISDTAENLLVKTLRNNGIEVEVLPDKIVLEAFFTQCEACQVVGVLTSALEYAHLFGHQAYSIYGLFEVQPPTFFDRMTGFWRNVERLTIS